MSPENIIPPPDPNAAESIKLENDPRERMREPGESEEILAMRNRKKFQFALIKKPLDAVAAVTATFFGAGLLPKAPGTWGTLAAIPLIFGISGANLEIQLMFWLLLFLAGCWAAKHLDEIMNTGDNQTIVIDEVVGMGIAALSVQSMSGLIAAFILFRAFDIIKPFPIQLIDQWSKHKARQKADRYSAWWGGVGVMADDVAAGLQALLFVAVLQKMGVVS